MLRDRLASPVWLPRGGIAEKEGEPDRLYDQTSRLPAGLRAITIDNRFAGDTVLCWTAPGGERVLFGGDALIGGSGVPGHWRCEPGIHLWMQGPIDEARFRRCFRPLLDEHIDLIFSAHGGPIPFRDDPTGTLAQMLDQGTFRPTLLGGIGLSLAPRA